MITAEERAERLYDTLHACSVIGMDPFEAIVAEIRAAELGTLELAQDVAAREQWLNAVLAKNHRPYLLWDDHIKLVAMARKQALEEAVKVVETERDEWNPRTLPTIRAAITVAVNAIRALAQEGTKCKD